VKRPPYPRVPHLAPGPGATRDDLVLSREACERLLEGGVHIEEKLDGANISLAIGDNRQIEVASRGGPGAIDRGNHLGRARAWATERSDALHRLLADGRILYGEWLLTRHSVGYDSLPDLLVGFDLFEPKVGWISVHDRDERLHNAGLATPPVLGEFDNIDLAAVDALIGPSAFGAPSAEGLILRSVHARNDVPRLAKRLAAGVPQLMDDAFGPHRQENRMTDSAVSA
jgi:RNA ligase